MCTNASQHSYLRDFEVYPNGNIIASFVSGCGNGASDMGMMLLDPQGNVIWEKIVMGGGNDHIGDIHILPSGDFIGAGSTQSLTNGGSTNGMFFIGTPAGTFSSASVFGSVPGSVTRIIGLDVHPTDGIILYGFTEDFQSANNRFGFLLKYDSNFSYEWGKIVSTGSSSSIKSARFANGEIFANLDISGPEGVVEFKINVSGDSTSASGQTILGTSESTPNFAHDANLFHSQTKYLLYNFNDNGVNSWSLAFGPSGSNLFCDEFNFPLLNYNPSTVNWSFSLENDIVEFFPPMADGSLPVQSKINECACEGSTLVMDTVFCDIPVDLVHNETRTNYSWSPSNGLSCTNCPFPSASPSVNTLYELIIDGDSVCTYLFNVESNACDCQGSTTLLDTLMCKDESLILTHTIPGQTYEWSPGGSLSCMDCETPIASPTASTVYELVVDGMVDCPYYFEIELDNLCSCEIDFPNVFTPNNDLINDGFIPEMECEPIAYQLDVYNRWGQLMFTTNDPKIEWEGTNLNQALASEGAYYYV